MDKMSVSGLSGCPVGACEPLAARNTGYLKLDRLYYGLNSIVY